MAAALRVSLIPLSLCPVAGLAWRRPNSGWTLTVVCRATFPLRPGRASLSPVQHLPVTGDRASPGGSIPDLYAPSDLVPVKPRADVLVVGARPTGGRTARIAVGDLDKRTEDPVRDLGPVPATAPSRAALRGAGPDAPPADWNGRGVAADLDPAYFNVAPPDQQLAALRGDERLVLENLSLEHPELSMVLPGIRPLAIVEGASFSPRRIAMRADTLWIEASRGLGALVWRGQVALEGSAAIRVLVDVELPAMPELRVAMPRAALQQTVGLPDDRVFDAVPLPFVPTGPSATPAPRGPLVGGGLPFRQAESAAVSPWAKGIAPRAGPLPPEPEPASAPAAAAPRPPQETLDLLWFDPVSARRVRREPPFAAILAAMDEEAPDLELDPLLDDGDLADREDRRDIFEVLARGEAVGEDGAATALHRARRPDGRLVQPVILLAGEVTLAFEALSILKAVSSAAARLAGADAKVAALVALAHELLAAPGAAYAPAAAAALADRLRAAAVAPLPEKQRPAAVEEIHAEVTRGLLDARAFEHRRVLGALHVRARFHLAEPGRDPSAGPLDAYLPEALARTLPRAERLRMRMLAFVHPALDDDGRPALRPLAVAVVTPRIEA